MASATVVPLKLTVCVSELLDVSYCASPLYSAVMVWGPTLSAEVVRVAWLPLRVMAGPSGVPPSLKVTLPVGVPWTPGSYTVAVKVTDYPTKLGFSEETSAASDVNLLTTCCVSVSLEGSKVGASPL